MSYRIAGIKQGVGVEPLFMLHCDRSPLMLTWLHQLTLGHAVPRQWWLLVSTRSSAQSMLHPHLGSSQAGLAVKLSNCHETTKGPRPRSFGKVRYDESIT
jgi:hypothetical protein